MLQLANEDDGQKSTQLPVQLFSRELAIAIEEYNHIILKPCCLIKGTPYLHFVSSRVDSSQLEEHFLGLILLQGSLKHLQQGLLCTVQIFQVHQPHPNIHLFLFFPEKKKKRKQMAIEAIKQILKCREFKQLILTSSAIRYQMTRQQSSID